MHCHDAFVWCIRRPAVSNLCTHLPCLQLCSISPDTSTVHLKQYISTVYWVVRQWHLYTVVGATVTHLITPLKLKYTKPHQRSMHTMTSGGHHFWLLSRHGQRGSSPGTSSFSSRHYDKSFVWLIRSIFVLFVLASIRWLCMEARRSAAFGVH